jgi:hypothetical protein
MSSHTKRIVRVATSVALMVLTLAGFAVAGVGRTTSQSHLRTTSRILTDLPPARPSSSSGRLEHGVVLATLPAEDAPRLDRVVVPGAADRNAIDPQLRDWAHKHDLPVDALHGPGADVGFDGALEYLLATAGPATAVSAAKMIDYRTTNLDLKRWRCRAEGAAAGASRPAGCRRCRLSSRCRSHGQAPMTVTRTSGRGSTV